MPPDLIMPEETAAPVTKAIETPVVTPAAGEPKFANLARNVLRANTPGLKAPEAQKPDAIAPVTVQAKEEAKSKEDNIVALRKKLEEETINWTAKQKASEEAVAAAKTKAEQLEARLAKYNIRETLVFEQRFGAPRQQAQAQIDAALAKIGMTMEEWAATVQGGMEKVNGVLAALKEKKKEAEGDELMMATHAAGAIEREAARFVEAHQGQLQTVKEMEDKAQLDAKEGMLALRTSKIQQVREAVQTKEPWGVFLKPREGDAAWNDQVARLNSEADQIINSNDFDRQASAAHAAALMPMVVAQLGAYRKEIAELKTRLGGVSGAAAAASGVGGGSFIPSTPRVAAAGWDANAGSLAQRAVAKTRGG